jgi:hypothetical protein
MSLVEADFQMQILHTFFHISDIFIVTYRLLLPRKEKGPQILLMKHSHVVET